MIAAIALTVLMFGLVFKGWLLAVGLIMLVISLVGWLRDARAEYVLAERADRIGHLEAMPAPVPRSAPSPCSGSFSFWRSSSTAG